MENGDALDEFRKIVAPPFTCICTLRYYDANSLLNHPDFRLF